MELNGIRCLLIQKEFKSADHAPLTPREREIARLVACGQPNKAIAAQLEISSWTVGTHLRRIYSKLGVCCRAAMVARLEAERTPEHDYH
jgi:DNA-binding NarL/FixJ family response regulator